MRWGIKTRRKPGKRIPLVEAEHPMLTVVRLRSQREVEDWIAGPLIDSLDHVS